MQTYKVMKTVINMYERNINPAQKISECKTGDLIDLPISAENRVVTGLVLQWQNRIDMKKVFNVFILDSTSNFYLKVYSVVNPDLEVRLSTKYFIIENRAN